MLHAPAGPSRAPDRALIWPVVCGALVRFAYLLLASPRKPHGDDAFYWETARSLAASGSFEFAGQPTADFMPGLPLLLAPFIRLGGDLGVARLFLVVLSIATIPVVFSLASSWFGRRAGSWTAWFFALFPPFWFYATAILTETVAVLVVTLQLLLVERARARSSVRIGLALGLCYGLLMYLKPELAVLGPAYLAVSMLWPARLPWKVTSLMVCVGIATLVPWTVRNWMAFGEFIPLKATGGMLVFFASHDPPILEVDDPRLKAADLHLRVVGKPGATGRNYGKEGLARIIAAPLPYLRDCFTVRGPRLFLGSQTEAADGLSRSFAALRGERAYAAFGVKAFLLVIQATVSALGLVALCRRLEPRLTLGQVHFWSNVGVYVGLMAVPRYSMVLMPILVPHALHRLALARSSFWRGAGRASAAPLLEVRLD